MLRRRVAGGLLLALCATLAPSPPAASRPQTVEPQALPTEAPPAEPAAAAGAWPELPLIGPDGAGPPLYVSVDVALEARLREAIEARSQMRRLVRGRKMAVGLVDLSDPLAPRFARLNGRQMMYAASLPKIAILLAAYQAFEDGRLEETPELRAELAAMIRTSSNSAATRFIDLLGFEEISRVLTDPRYRFYDRERGGGLWVGKRFAKKGRRVGDPLLGISHAATVTQVCRFYYLLATGRIISAERSRQMLADLADPGLHHKFVAVLEEKAPRARLFRKSGTWKIWHSDSILVWGPDWRRYILAAMVESPDGDRLLRDLVPIAEGLLQP